MGRALSFTNTAVLDLSGIKRWLTQSGSGRVAHRRFKELGKAIDQLRRHPCRYLIGACPGVREVPCAEGYRVFYDVDPDPGRDDSAGSVRVSRVYKPGQDRGGFGREEAP